MCPETSLKARDKPFGGKVLEIDCLPSVNLFFPWRSHWLPPEPICDNIWAKNGIFHKCEGGVLLCVPPGEKLDRTKFYDPSSPHFNQDPGGCPNTEILSPDIGYFLCFSPIFWHIWLPLSTLLGGNRELGGNKGRWASWGWHFVKMKGILMIT